jgi:hypothetical protein
MRPWWAGSSCAIRTGRSASCGSTGSVPSTSRSRLRTGSAEAASSSRTAPSPSWSEGFSAGAGQFDSDITEGRYPRAALGVSDESLVAVACDGRRSNVDGGLSLVELAEVLVELGAERAINLDGGGSTTLVHRGHLLNRPYSSQDQPAPASRPVVSAVAFEPRA